MAAIEIIQAFGNSELEAFIEFPWLIYADDGNWIAPLRSQARRLLDPTKHPFWKSAERELFIARRGSEIVGRVAAIVDHHSNQHHGEQIGTWGFFECRNDPDAAQLLFTAVEKWLRAKGMKSARGPMNPSPNYEIGLLVEGFQYPPAVMMTYNPTYYPDLIEASGFEKEKDLLALRVDASHTFNDRIQRLVDRVRSRGKVRIRPIRVKELASEIALLRELYEEAWSDNWAFSPLSQGEASELVSNFRWFGDPDLVFFIYYDDEPAGVAMFLPDVNQVLKRLNGKLGLIGLVKAALYRRQISGMRGVLFGIKKKYQRLGVSLAALDYINHVARKKKYRHAEFSWVLEDNLAAHRLGRVAGAQIYKRYRIYKKAL